jgi:hypothetical protein
MCQLFLKLRFNGEKVNNFVFWPPIKFDWAFKFLDGKKVFCTTIQFLTLSIVLPLYKAQRFSDWILFLSAG